MVIAVQNLKGGVGKTTVATNLSCFLAEKVGNDNVLLVDADTQQSSLTWASRRPDNIPTITCVSNNNDAALMKQVKNYAKKYDWIIIDGAPNADNVAAQVTAISDVIIIPCRHSPMDLWSSDSRFKPVLERAIELEPNKKIFMLRNQVQAKTNLAKKAKEVMADMGFHVLDSYLSILIAFMEAPINGMSIKEYDPTSKASAEFEKLFNELWIKINE
jgi:chromosome partitioning protein